MIIVDTRHSLLVQTHRMYNVEREGMSVRCGLGVATTHQGGAISCQQCTLWWGW